MLGAPYWSAFSATLPGGTNPERISSGAGRSCPERLFGHLAGGHQSRKDLLWCWGALLPGAPFWLPCRGASIPKQGLLLDMPEGDPRRTDGRRFGVIIYWLRQMKEKAPPGPVAASVPREALPSLRRRFEGLLPDRPGLCDSSTHAYGQLCSRQFRVNKSV